MNNLVKKGYLLLISSVFLFIISGCVYDDSNMTKISVGGLDVTDSNMLEDFLGGFENHLKQEGFTLDNRENSATWIWGTKVISGNVIQCGSGVSDRTDLVTIICRESWKPWFPYLPEEVTEVYSRVFDGVLIYTIPFGITKMERKFYNGKVQQLAVPKGI